MVMLKYHIPAGIRSQAASFDCFRPLAVAMVNYDLFQPQVWKNVHVDGTLNQFLSTAMYQVVRRVRSDDRIEINAYPSFERTWRREIASRLRHDLVNPPDAVCPGIHRVIPIGVSSSDALQAMQVAIPNDLVDSYAITVQSAAIDDQCGSIVITQPMQYTVITVNCMINPGILVDVCRELRIGHKAVVDEVHSVRRELSLVKSVMINVNEETSAKLLDMTEKHNESNSLLRQQHEESNSLLRQQLFSIQNEMSTLITRLTGTNNGINCPANTGDGVIKCSKRGCDRVVTKRFRSGKSPRQCPICLEYAHAAKKRKHIQTCPNLTKVHIAP